jgi:hypothetical protein
MRKMFLVVITFEKFQALHPTGNKLQHRKIYFFLTFGTEGNISCTARFFPNSKSRHGRNMNAVVH